MTKKILSLLLCAVLAFSLAEGFSAPVFADTDADAPIDAPLDTPADTPADTGEETQLPPLEKGDPILAYVPLDNRPVNVDRVIYEAESAGFQVLMPDPDLYATHLDGQPANENGTFHGDSEKLLAWIQAADQQADYFVISLDQLLSGGLVNSRVMDNTHCSDEFKIIDAVTALSETNHVYIIDTVARLATCTVGYHGATLDTYNYLRQYSMTPRRMIRGNALTLDAVTGGYTMNESSWPIKIDSRYEEEVRKALRTRKRKLTLTDYILQQDAIGRMKYFIGIDDSSSANTIQTNEISYLRKTLGDRGLIYSGADELGMTAVMSLMIDYYGYDIKASTTYFGGTENASSGSAYDLETVRENMDSHLSSIGIRSVAPQEADLQILVLTTPEKATLNAKYVTRMIDRINENAVSGIPTIVINAAPSAYNGNLEFRMIRECEASMLLSYSSWGTVGNSIGLALANGVSRYLYLHSQESSSDSADRAFLRGLTFSLVKDISYIRGGGRALFNASLEAKGFSTSNFYKDDAQAQTVLADLEKELNESDYNVTVNEILANLTDSRYLKSLSGECGIIGDIRLSNFTAPFYRSYEIHFDINLHLVDVTINGFDKAVTVSMPFAPEPGEVTYSLNLYYLDENGKLQKVPCTYSKTSGTVTFATNQLPFYVSSLSMDQIAASALFSDVPSSAWYYDSILYVYDRGIMNGTSGRTFSPEQTMTRAMLAGTLYNMAGKPLSVPDAEESLPADVPGESWFAPAVRWAMDNGLMTGDGSGSFGPNDPVTREQLATILYRFAQKDGVNVSKGNLPGAASFADYGSVMPVLAEGMDWACRSGMIAGGSGKLMPKETATRAQVAAILKRYREQ